MRDVTAIGLLVVITGLLLFAQSSLLDAINSKRKAVWSTELLQTNPEGWVQQNQHSVERAVDGVTTTGAPAADAAPEQHTQAAFLQMQQAVQLLTNAGAAMSKATAEALTEENQQAAREAAADAVKFGSAAAVAAADSVVAGLHNVEGRLLEGRLLDGIGE